MEFEWDPAKSESNCVKHGISFAQALEIWQGLTVTVPEIAKSCDGEQRGATLGLVRGEVYTAIWTIRSGYVRLISVRRARHGEKEIYYKKI